MIIKNVDCVWIVCVVCMLCAMYAMICGWLAIFSSFSCIPPLPQINQSIHQSIHPFLPSFLPLYPSLTSFTFPPPPPTFQKKSSSYSYNPHFCCIWHRPCLPGEQVTKRVHHRGGSSGSLGRGSGRGGGFGGMECVGHFCGMMSWVG